MSDYQLKPCPFCGKMAKITWLLGRRCIACTGCLAAMIPSYQIEKEHLVRQWNRRADPLPKPYKEGERE